MDRRSFIDAISAKTGISKEDTGLLLDALRDTIAERCSESDSVALPGFGAFEAKNVLNEWPSIRPQETSADSAQNIPRVQAFRHTKAESEPAYNHNRPILCTT